MGSSNCKELNETCDCANKPSPSVLNERPKTCCSGKVKLSASDKATHNLNAPQMKQSFIEETVRQLHKAKSEFVPEGEEMYNDLSNKFVTLLQNLPPGFFGSLVRTLSKILEHRKGQMLLDNPATGLKLLSMYLKIDEGNIIHLKEGTEVSFLREFFNKWVETQSMWMENYMETDKISRTTSDTKSSDSTTGKSPSSTSLSADSNPLRKSKKLSNHSPDCEAALAKLFSGIPCFPTYYDPRISFSYEASECKHRIAICLREKLTRTLRMLKIGINSIVILFRAVLNYLGIKEDADEEGRVDLQPMRDIVTRFVTVRDSNILGLILYVCKETQKKEHQNYVDNLALLKALPAERLFDPKTLSTLKKRFAPLTPDDPNYKLIFPAYFTSNQRRILQSMSSAICAPTKTPHGEKATVLDEIEEKCKAMASCLNSNVLADIHYVEYWIVLFDMWTNLHFKPAGSLEPEAKIQLMWLTLKYVQIDALDLFMETLKWLYPRLDNPTFATYHSTLCHPVVLPSPLDDN